MIPRIKVGKGVSGAVRYVLSEGKDRSGKYRTEPKGEASRVGWIAGFNLGFEVATAADADLARRVMEFDAANQNSRTRACEKDCVHLSLGWRKGEQPTREQMEEAARAALAALGMANAKAVIVAHTDEAYAHLHIVASKINPDTGRAYDLKGDRITLSRWAQAYEIDHSGGIVCIRRAEANQLRDAIERRDAGAVLALLTQQRATITAADVERALAKQIRQPTQRAQFGNQVLALPEVVRLAEHPGGPVTRYTTRTILQAEGQVLLAAKALHGGRRHRVGWQTARAVEQQPAFRSMSQEQRNAFGRAIEGEGLALIDGQAGTGKSYTMAAIRQAYEADGFAVIGLAPTNAVGQDMRGSGFAHADTIHAELFRLNNDRAPAWTARTVLMVDEAAMIDTLLMAQVMRRAEEAGAKVILIGDDRQLSSIDRGGMFGALKDAYGAAALTEVRRQHKPDDRRAAELMAEGNFAAALAIYNDKKAIHWQHNQETARAALVEQWAKDSAADPARSRFVFAYTNDDVDQLNAALRQVRAERGELGQGYRFATKHGSAAFAAGDRIQLTGTADKRAGLVNGAAGTIERIEGSTIAVRLDGGAGRTLAIDAAQFRDFRHGYAGTIYKGQGRTLDQTYLYHSEHWRASSGYVALTRHREKMEIFAARDVVEDLNQLARQMARVDDRRAASRFHQVDGALEIERTPTAELPKVELPPRDGVGLAKLREQVANENRPHRQAPEPQRRTRTMLDGPTDDELKRQPGRVAEYLAHMRQAHERAAAVLAERQRAQELDKRARDYQQKAEQEAEAGKKRQAEQDAAEDRDWRNGDISSAAARYSIAIGQCYNVRDPYASLARAAGAEAAAFHQKQEALRTQAATAKDPEQRQVVELRRRIEACEYMAVTSDRLAGIGLAVTGRLDSGQAIKDRQQAADWRAQAAALREERSALLEAREPKPAPVIEQQASTPAPVAANGLEDRRPASTPYRSVMPATTPEQAAQPDRTPAPEPAKAPEKALSEPAPEPQRDPPTPQPVPPTTPAAAPTPPPVQPEATRPAQAAPPQPDAAQHPERPAAAPVPADNVAQADAPPQDRPADAQTVTVQLEQQPFRAIALKPHQVTLAKTPPPPPPPSPPSPPGDAPGTGQEALQGAAEPPAEPPAQPAARYEAGNAGPMPTAPPGPAASVPGTHQDAAGPVPPIETERAPAWQAGARQVALPGAAAPAPAPAPAVKEPPEPAKVPTRRVVEASAEDRAAARAAGVTIRRVSEPTAEPTNSRGITRTVEVTDRKAVATGMKGITVRRVTDINRESGQERENERGGRSR